MFVDSHVHVGQYYDLYFSPTDVIRLMADIGVGYYAVSSTTTCEENYEKVLSELRELIRLDGDKVLPVMWITPEGLKGNIAWLLESSIKWRCLKVHPFLHQNVWSPDSGQFAEVIDIARELHVPLLIHTGNEDCCQCEQYESLIASNSDIDFILAHGRPLQQIIPILKTYSNAYTDSAFMSIDDMSILVQEGLSCKLLWGTDMCIPKYFYPKENLVECYRKKIEAFKSVCSNSQYGQVTCSNARKVFRI